MSHNGDPVTGTFVWFERRARDVEAVWRFYQGVFGWERGEPEPAWGAPPGHGAALVRVGGAHLGRIAPADSRVPSAGPWIGYVAVHDLDAAVAGAARAGGRTSQPPAELPGRGRYAVLLDPGGAAFAAVQWMRAPGPPLPTGPLAFCWSELLTPDPEPAAQFCSRVFGWTQDVGEPNPQGPYWLLRRAGRAIAGVVRRAADAEIGPGWLHYVRIPQIDAAARRATRLGGTLLLRPTLAPRAGRFAVLADPEGVPIALFEGRAGR